VRNSLLSQILLLSVLSQGLPISGAAAQLGVVDEEHVPAYANPDSSSPVVFHLRKGKKVMASNYPLNGFYKIRRCDDEFGWVESSTLILKPQDSLVGGSPAEAK
jgi:hypothetical protein